MARKVVADKRHGGGMFNFLIWVCVGKIDKIGIREHASQPNIRAIKGFINALERNDCIKFVHVIMHKSGDFINVIFTLDVFS